MQRRFRLVLLPITAVALLACSSDSAGDAANEPTTASVPDATVVTEPASPAEAIVFGGQGNNLDVYASTPSADGTFKTQRIFATVATDPTNGRDINAQICFLPLTEDGEQWFIAGEDTGQDDPNRPAGWGIFRLDGSTVGEFEATQIGKLETTFQEANDNPENYGCGVLPDGRVLTTDIGNQASGDGDGQLIIWFPPLTGGEFPDHDAVAHCKIDVTLPTAQSILVRGEDVYVAAARGDVYRYTGPFPTSADPAGGCGKQDPTGAPLADTVNKETFIASGENGIATPAGLATAPDDGMYVSSVFTGVIAEFGPDGSFRRTILAPPEGEQFGAKPYSTGSPLGIGVDETGTIYYADIGIVAADGNVGPGEMTGNLRRIRFVGGEPQAPEVMASGLEYPDGIGVLGPGG